MFQLVMWTVTAHTAPPANAATSPATLAAENDAGEIVFLSMS